MHRLLLGLTVGAQQRIGPQRPQRGVTVTQRMVHHQ